MQELLQQRRDARAVPQRGCVGQHVRVSGSDSYVLLFLCYYYCYYILQTMQCLRIVGVL